MTAILLWLFGVLTIASAIMFVAWGRAAGDLRRGFDRPWWKLIWCKAYMLAAALTLHAGVMVSSAGYRAHDLMRGFEVAGSDADFLALNLSGLAVSKFAFVWAGSIDEAVEHVRWPWWAFLYSLILWALFCATWTAGYLS